MRRLLKDASDDENYLDRVVAAATTENGVFGAKVHWAHFLNLVSKLDGPSDPAMERLRRHFPDLRYIHLIRKNAVARAISHYRAKKTGLWHPDSTPDDSGGEGEPAFDFDQIENFVRIGETEDATWRQFFRSTASGLCSWFTKKWSPTLPARWAACSPSSTFPRGPTPSVPRPKCTRLSLDER